MRGLIDQGAHEFVLIAQGPFRHLPLLDLPAHVAVPGQGCKQQQPGGADDLDNQTVVVAPIAVGGGRVATPAVVDDPKFVRRDAEQGLVKNGGQFGGTA